MGIEAPLGSERFDVSASKRADELQDKKAKDRRDDPAKG
jgi:hypothetical protein